jgi:mRNA interferase MazF
VGRFVKGEVVVLPFPFSDLSASKRRPALVITPLQGDDVILCMITSRAVRDSNAMPITNDDFASGGLSRDSNIRPTRLFTADSRIILRSVGRLSNEKMEEVVDAIVKIIQA